MFAWRHQWQSIPKGTRAMLSTFLVLGLGNLLSRAYSGELQNGLALDPPQFRGGRYWQLLTYAFVSRGWLDLLFNLVMVYVLAGGLERVWTARRLWAYSLLVILSAGTAKLWLDWNHQGSLAGAAGLTLGLLLAWGWVSENLTVPLPGAGAMPARLAALVLGILSLGLSLSSGWTNVLALAMGAIGGGVLLWCWDGRRGPQPRSAAPSRRMEKLEL